MKNVNIMIVGVGGQGTLLASRILGNAILSLGYDVKVTGIDFISYSELFTGSWDNKVMIDELETFVSTYIDAKVIGYSLTNED